jgi:ABC-2 type transport system permease protein
MNATIFRTEVRDELLAIVREPTALFFTVLMPVAFFALFATMFGTEGDGFGVGSVATYGAFGVLSVVLITRVSASPTPGSEAGYGSSERTVRRWA